MKKYIVKIAALLVFSIFVFCGFGMNAYAITTDGILTESDWKKAPAVVLENQRSFNNKVKSAVVKTVEDRKNGYIYIAVMIEFDKSGDLKDGAVKLSVNETSPALIKIGDGVVEKGDYSVEAGSDTDELTGCTVTEIAVFFRDGLSSTENFKINIVDSEGTESGTYTVTVKEKEPETTAPKTEKPTEPKTTKPTTSKTTKTTTTKTTTTKTTKATTTKTTKTTTTKTTKTTTTKTTTSRTTVPRTTKTTRTTTEKTSSDEITSAKKDSVEKPDSDRKTTKDDFTFKKAVKTTSVKPSAKIKKTKRTTQKKTSAKQKKSTSAVYENEQPVSKIKTAAGKESTQAESIENTVVNDAVEGKSRKYSFVAVGSLSAALLAAAAVTVAVKSNKKEDKED